MSCQLNEKDDLNDDNLATHTELVGNVGYDKRQGVVEYLMGLAPSSIPAAIPTLPAVSGLTSISSRASEVQDAYEQGLQKQDQDEQDASKSIQISLPTEEGRTVSINTPSRRAAFIKALLSRAPSSLLPRNQSPPRSALSTRILSNRTFCRRVQSSRISSKRSSSPSPLPSSPLPSSSVVSKRKHEEGCDNNAQVSEMARISRGKDVRRRDRQESMAAAVESTGFKKPKVHHSLTGDMGVEMSATFKNIKDCKIRIRK